MTLPLQDFSDDRTIHPSGLEEEAGEVANSWGLNRLASIGFHRSVDRVTREEGVLVDVTYWKPC